MDLSTTIKGKTLPNPVGVASGVFGYAKEYELLTDLGGLGAIYTKAITPLPRKGNPSPRMAETRLGMLNSIGLANVGLEVFKEQKLPFLVSTKVPIIVNVAGSTEDDYVQVVSGLEESEGIWGFEINVSCPNVNQGGQTFGADPKVLSSLIKLLRPHTKKPLLVKLSPNTSDITELALAAESEGADALTAINTLKGMVIDIYKKRSAVKRGVSGFSGPAILPVGVAAVYSIAQAVKIPVVGVGGISRWEDAVQYLLAGACAVQIGSALFAEPELPSKILSGIIAYAQDNHFQTLNDFHRAFIKPQT